MSKLNALFAAVLATAALLPTAALANPIVSVRLDLPPIVIGTPPPPVVVYRPAPRPVVVVARPAYPGPNHLWVDGTWRHDAYGRPMWVAGHWRAQPVIVHRAAPARTVVVKHKVHGHKHRY